MPDDPHNVVDPEPVQAESDHLSKSLSHAVLVVAYLCEEWPVRCYRSLAALSLAEAMGPGLGRSVFPRLCCPSGLVLVARQFYVDSFPRGPLFRALFVNKVFDSITVVLSQKLQNRWATHSPGSL